MIVRPTGIPMAIAALIAIPSITGAQTREVGNAGFTRGDSAAPITVVEFGDFGCSACAMFARETFPVLEAEFVSTGQVYWRFIPFVLGPFRHAEEAAVAALCAGAQAAFWPMHDVLYARRHEWLDPRDPSSVFQAFATELQLDVKRFAECYETKAIEDRVKQWTKLARRLGVRATPTFFVNDRRALGALPPDDFRWLLEQALQALARP